MSQSRESRLKQRLQQERRKNREILDAAQSLIEENEQLSAQPDAIQEKLRALNEHVHRQAFNAAAKDAGVDPAHLDDLWKLSPLEIGDDLPDDKAVAKHVKAAVKARPAMVKPAADAGADDDGDDGDDGQGGDEAGATEGAEAAGGAPPAKPAAAPAKLSRGEGASRGGRDDHKPQTLAQIVDSDFAATGRTDAFKI
jgi:hypothetical protein